MRKKTSLLTIACLSTAGLYHSQNTHWLNKRWAHLQTPHGFQTLFGTIDAGNVNIRALGDKTTPASPAIVAGEIKRCKTELDQLLKHQSPATLLWPSYGFEKKPYMLETSTGNPLHLIELTAENFPTIDGQLRTQLPKELATLTDITILHAEMV